MEKRKEKPLVAIDIGSKKIVVLVGHKTGSETFDVIGKGEVKCESMRKGIIADIEETISCLSAALEEAERMSGLPVDDAVVSIGGGHINATNSKGVIAVSRPDGEITEEDLNRVIEAARAISQPTNREIIHVIPCSYTVDGQEGIKNPIGMTGIRLEVEAHVITGSSPAIKNLTTTCSQAGINIQDIVFNGLADSYPLISQKDQDIGVALADIGGETTDLVVFEDGDIIHSAVIPVGSSHITHDVAIGLKTSVDIAEKVKLKYGSCDPEKSTSNEMIDLKEFSDDEDQTANKKYLAEIIEARTSEILKLVREELKKIDRDGMLPAGVIITGGGSKLDGVIDLTKDVVRLPANLGKPQIEVTGLIDEIDDPIYSTSLGLLMWSGEKKLSGGSFVDLSNIESIGQKIKDWFKQFVT